MHCLLTLLLLQIYRTYSLYYWVNFILLLNYIMLRFPFYRNFFFKEKRVNNKGKTNFTNALFLHFSGLDDVILPYIHYFVNNQVDGKRLLQLSHDELPSLHVTKIGHQEIILQGVELLRNIVCLLELCLYIAWMGYMFKGLLWIYHWPWVD